MCTIYILLFSSSAVVPNSDNIAQFCLLINPALMNVLSHSQVETRSVSLALVVMF